MAPKICFMSFAVLVLALPLCFQTSLGEEKGVTCERMSAGTCAFAVSWSGKRCVLERSMKMRSGIESYVCRTSEIEAAEKVKKNTIESDHCVEACGLDRKALGISSDSLFDPRFTRKLCSPQCYLRCPNVVDLYFNVAAGEGVSLPRLCAAQKKSLRRSMSENLSSRIAEIPLSPPAQHVDRFLLGLAPGPASAVEATDSEVRSSFALAPESADPVETTDFTERSLLGFAPDSAEPVEAAELFVALEPAEPIESADPIERSSLILAPEPVENTDFKERALYGFAPEPAKAVETANFKKRSLFGLAPEPAEPIKTADSAERSLLGLAPEPAEPIETGDSAERSLLGLAPEPAEAIETTDSAERSLLGLAPEPTEAVETADFS